MHLVSIARILNSSRAALARRLWEEDAEFMSRIAKPASVPEAKEATFEYLNARERHYFSVYLDPDTNDMHIIERNNAKECIRVLKNLIRSENERLTGSSAFRLLRKIARGGGGALEKVSEGFLCEFLFLFRGMNGRSGIGREVETLETDSARGATVRSRRLDHYARTLVDGMSRFRAGTDPDARNARARSKRKILRELGGDSDDWDDYLWHMRHIFRDRASIEAVVKLDEDEKAGLDAAEVLGMPVQVTPYYLSLFNLEGRDIHDRAVRAQVLPSRRYCQEVANSNEAGCDMDFMGERSTSPVELVTRRYPQICILKPFNSCPQICVYCQRNWEISGIEGGAVTPAKLDEGIRWIADHDSIVEVLVTGGDPLTLPDGALERLMGRLSRIDHIERLRIGTRTPVTLPQRFTDGFLEMVASHHEWGRREICFVTHYEHPSEMTTESAAAVASIRNRGMSVYNQQVFTFYTSLRFETCKLRSVLKLNGVDPYYAFNTKGKDETIDFRVPMARIEQERKEEARLMPGIVRTDEPVFNVPKLGKSHLRAWQDHEPVMLLPDGRRVYRFFPWESKISLEDDYLYTDVSIYDYLVRLETDGEDVEQYASIWYYF